MTSQAEIERNNESSLSSRDRIPLNPPPIDLREFIARLEAEKDLVRVRVEVDWNLEIGAITRRAIVFRAPAPLFESIRGYGQGFRVLGCPVGPTRTVIQGRIAVSMGVSQRHSPTPVD